MGIIENIEKATDLLYIIYPTHFEM